MPTNILTQVTYQKLLKDLKNIINLGLKKSQEYARFQLVLTYWNVGQRINDEKMSENSDCYIKSCV